VVHDGKEDKVQGKNRHRQIGLTFYFAYKFKYNGKRKKPTDNALFDIIQRRHRQSTTYWISSKGGDQRSREGVTLRVKNGEDGGYLRRGASEIAVPFVNCPDKSSSFVEGKAPYELPI